MNDSTVESMKAAIKELIASLHPDEMTEDEIASLLSLTARIKVRIETAPKPAAGQKPKLKAVGTE
jgi:hypothetical protein